MKTNRSAVASQMADLIERFVDGRIGQYEWDDFMGSRFDDPFVERMRLAALTVPQTFPSERDEYCSDQGTRRLLEIAFELRGVTERERSDHSSGLCNGDE